MYFIHLYSFSMYKSLDIEEEKKKNAQWFLNSLITIQTEFIVAVRHFTMSAHSELIKMLKMCLQYNKSAQACTKHVWACCFVMRVYFKVQLMLEQTTVCLDI